MEKIGQLDLDVSSLKAQAKELYQKLDEMNIDISDEQVQGLLSSIASWFGNLWETIKGWLE